MQCVYLKYLRTHNNQFVCVPVCSWYSAFLMGTFFFLGNHSTVMGTKCRSPLSERVVEV